jgi:hypothetical protein
MKIIFSTLFNTIAALFNVGALMLLLIYIYAVMGISLFAAVKMKDPSDRVNFEDIANSYLTLVRLLTGEAWGDLLGQLD